MKTKVVLTVAGVALMLVGVAGALRNSVATRPSDLLGWTLLSGLAHDAVIAPAAVIIGLATVRVVPAAARVPVRLALAFSALVALIAYPYVRGYGRTALNPSALPLDYRRNLVVALISIWFVAAVAVVANVVRTRR